MVSVNPLLPMGQEQLLPQQPPGCVQWKLTLQPQQQSGLRPQTLVAGTHGGGADGAGDPWVTRMLVIEPGNVPQQPCLPTSRFVSG